MRTVASSLPTKRLRILMVLDIPWDPTFGAARVQIDLAHQFSALGHVVDHFCYDDAYSSPPRMPQLAALTRNFPRRASRYIRQHSGRYDVIDARHASLVASKRALRFKGLLVTRSTGLLPVYEREFLAEERRLRHRGKRLLTRPIRWVERLIAERRSALALSRSDLISVLNAEEEAYCRDVRHDGHKTVKLLHGLTRARMREFVEAQHDSAARLREPRIAFVGAWSRRKGSHDMGSIVRAVRERVPDTAFSFLGTDRTREEVLDELGVGESGVFVCPHFESDELPSLLGGATVGVLPSYVEGFPFSIIEMLAAGLPVVAYDAPGARETLPLLDASLMVPRGDALAVASRLADVLTLGEEPYASLSERATAVADELRWERIGQATIALYQERLARLR